MESSNRFLSRLAVYEGDFRGEEGLVAAIARIEARCNTEPSASTGVPPAVLFMREKEELRKVGNMGLLESMVADVSVQAVPPTMLVRCRGREFSVPRRCIGRRVKVLAMPSGQVRVEMAGETVAVHDLSAPGGPVVYDPAHYAEALAAKARYADADIEAAARANLELARQARGGVAVSARDEGGAYARIRENLSELGLDAMAAGLPHWMSAVAAGEADFASAMLAMTSEEAEAKRRRGTDRKVRAAGFRSSRRWPTSTSPSSPPYPGPSWTTWPRSGSWTRPRTWLLLGSPGVGKTHSRWALGVEAVRRPQGGALHRLRGAGARPEGRLLARHPGEEAEVLRPRDAAHHRRARLPGRGRGGGRPAVPARSRPATSTAPRSSPPTWPWAFGPTCSGTR